MNDEKKEVLKELLEKNKLLQAEIEERMRKIADDMTSERYKGNFFYAVDQYTRKKYHQIRKNTFTVSTGVFMIDRERALHMCDHFREIGELEWRIRGKKHYIQVRLVNRITDESFIIAGGRIVQNLYGLASEAAFLPHSEMETTIVDQPITTSIFELFGKPVRFPGITEEIRKKYPTHFPTILASQLDSTFNYTRRVVYTNPYFSFFNEVNLYEERQSSK